MSLRLDDPAPETDRKRPSSIPFSNLGLTRDRHVDRPPLLTAMNTPDLSGLTGAVDPTARQALFGGMFDGGGTEPAAVVPPAVVPSTPHNGYNKQDLQQLYSDQAGYTEKDREFKELDFWVNRIAQGEGAFNTAEDLNDGGKLSVGILQWTQNSGRLGGLMQAYQAAAQRENNPDLFNDTFGGQKQADSWLNTLTGKTPGSLSSSTLQDEFQNAGNIDTFKRVQVERARSDVRTDLENVNGMVPEMADGTVSGKQLAAALIMNNIGPGSPNRIFKAVDEKMYNGIKDQRPDVRNQLKLRSDAQLAQYEYEHADELKALSPEDREKRLTEQRQASSRDFYSGLSGRYGDVSEQANQQTDLALAQYEKEHGLDPANPEHKAQIDQARADLGIEEYAKLVEKGPTIGQRVEGTIKTESDTKVGEQMADYEASHAAELDKMTPKQRDRAIAKQRAALTKEVAGSMEDRRNELQRDAVQTNVSEDDYNETLIKEVPRQLYKKKNYNKFHRGVENRLRTAMEEIDVGHRVNLDQL